MLFIGSHSNLFLRLKKIEKFLRNLFFAIGRIWETFAALIFCDLGPKIAKNFVPQKINAANIFMPAKN